MSTDQPIRVAIVEDDRYTREGLAALINGTPGVAMLHVEPDGATGGLAFFSPIGSQATDSPNDPHGIAIRRVDR